MARGLGQRVRSGDAGLQVGDDVLAGRLVVGRVLSAGPGCVRASLERAHREAVGHHRKMTRSPTMASTRRREATWAMACRCRRVATAGRPLIPSPSSESRDLQFWRERGRERVNGIDEPADRAHETLERLAVHDVRATEVVNDLSLGHPGLVVAHVVGEREVGHLGAVRVAPSGLSQVHLPTTLDWKPHPAIGEVVCLPGSAPDAILPGRGAVSRCSDHHRLDVRGRGALSVPVGEPPGEERLGHARVVALD